MPSFVGRVEPLARLAAAYQAVTLPPSGRNPVRAAVLLVTGEAGIGKTALLARFADDVVADGGTVAFGSCWDGEQAPAWWPWTQALRSLLDQLPTLADPDSADLGAVLPELSHAARHGVGAAETSSRIGVFDAVGRLLRRAAAEAPLVLLLDDLHWADPSTVELLRFVAHQPRSGALLLVGAYRPREPRADVAAALADLSTGAELLPLTGLAPDEVADLMVAVTGNAAVTRWAQLVHERSGGHPFYARELCRLLPHAGPGQGTPVLRIPDAVRDVLDRRIARLTGGCRRLLESAAVAGSTVPLDVLAAVTGSDPTTASAVAGEAADAGILVDAGPRSDAEFRFVHDLYRETIYAGLAAGLRVELHHRVALALVHRLERGAAVFPAELAGHFAAAMSVAGTAPALAWANAAADADVGRFAFAEAAGQLTRVRTAATAAAAELADAELIQLLTAEADLRLRAGDAGSARDLLGAAWTRAVAAGEGDLIGAVALGLDRIGARFAMPRTELLGVLSVAREALRDSGTGAEARVIAALARQLQHSVPADRPRAGPLAEQAVMIARALNDPSTLAGCLLASHDTLWRPGTAIERAVIAAEIADLARRAEDAEGTAQAVLLTATAQLEQGSAACRASLAEYLYLSRELRQPRHDYLLRIREAALALLDGDIGNGERLSVEAAALGTAVGDSDTGNVRMSQRLEVVRARGDAAELRALADDAVRWWIGAPAHAHSVAAGFCARAGDLEGARRELDTVLALPDWRADRSYLWSIFIGELAVAAIAVDDAVLCEVLLDDLTPVASDCAVNGAFVCFMGAHAHRIGLLHAALGRTVPARRWLLEGLAVHRRLGARAWVAESSAALAALEGDDAAEHAARADSLRTELRLRAVVVGVPEANGTHPARLRRVGELWEAGYRGSAVHLRDSKGLRDLATLLDRPGTDVPALVLAGSPRDAGSGPADDVLDRTALLAYRRRLAELDAELDAADADADLAGRQRAADERERLLAELRRATRPGGRSRSLGVQAAERARKAVTARIRDAIRRIAEVHPELGRHLDRTVRTGISCRYDPDSG